MIINCILGDNVINTYRLAQEYIEYFKQYLDTEVSYGDIFLADFYNLYRKELLIYGRDFLITKKKYLRLNLAKYCDVLNSVQSQKSNPAQIRLKLANDKRVICLKGSDLKPIGKAIKIDISESEILLDILNQVNKLPEEEGIDE